MVVMADLLFIGDIVTTLFSITCNCGACYGELNAQGELYRGFNDGIKAKDLLFAIWILGVSSHPYPCIGIRGELGAAEEERVSAGAIAHDKPGKQPSFYNQIKACFVELFFKGKDLVKGAGPLRVSRFKAEG